MGGGSGSSGRLQRDPGAPFVPLSLRITWRGEVIGCPSGCSAIVDTGTSMLLGPSKEVAKIHSLINAKHVEKEVEYQVTGSLWGSSQERSAEPTTLPLSLTERDPM